MKKALKKSYPTEAEAKEALAAKHKLKPALLKLKKFHRTHWMFDVVPLQAEQDTSGSSDSENEKPRWVDFLKAWRDKNPDVAYQDAQKQAAEEFKAL